MSKPYSKAVIFETRSLDKKKLVRSTKKPRQMICQIHQFRR